MRKRRPLSLRRAVAARIAFRVAPRMRAAAGAEAELRRLELKRNELEELKPRLGSPEQQELKRIRRRISDIERARLEALGIDPEEHRA